MRLELRKGIKMTTRWTVFGLLFLGAFSNVFADQPIGSCNAPSAIVVCRSEQSSSGSLHFAFYDQNLLSGVEYQAAGGKTQLPCFLHEGPIAPEKPMNIAECYNPHVKDAGYFVTLSNADIAGRQEATVFEITIAGQKEIEKLSCSRMYP
jgi:hypothetical protein